MYVEMYHLLWDENKILSLFIFVLAITDSVSILLNSFHKIIPFSHYNCSIEYKNVYRTVPTIMGQK